MMTAALLERATSGGIDEYGHVYHGGQFLPFYVPRDHMPQIDESDYPQLIRDALVAGGCTFAVVPVSNLRAHQRIDHNRAIHMEEAVKMKPIVISSDGYVVDGNHRWWAHVHDGDEYINVIWLTKTFDKAIEWALSLPYVYEITPTTPIRD